MKTACVIGLGPAGLVAVKELKHAGFEVTAYDALSRVGGRWALDPTYDSGVWKELCMNGSRRSAEYSDYVWRKEDHCSKPGVEPDYRGVFPHNTEAREYLAAYAEHNNLAPHCQLNTKVVSTERTDSGTWRVTTKRDGEEETTRVFDYLVVCPGRQAKGRNQLKDKQLKDFSGRITHSAEFKSIHDFEGKRVLVVGASVSGSDISGFLARDGKCAKVVNSVITVPYYIERFTQDTNICVDSLLFQRLPVWLGRYLPDSISFQGLKSTILDYYPSQLTEEITGSAELTPHKDIRKAGLGYSSEYVQTVRDKLLTVKPAVQSSSESTVTFIDGSSEDFDVVICATGYDTNLSFLSKDILDIIEYTSPFTGAKETALYKYTLVPNVDNLALLGLFNGAGPIFFAFEIQARYISSIWSGRMARPTESKIQAGVETFKKFRESGLHNANELSCVVAEDLADELNLTPSVLEALRNPRSLLTSPIYGCYYRSKKELEGKEVAAKAKERFEYYVDHPDIAE